MIFGLAVLVPCPPTKDKLREHYERCLEACEHEENRKIFREELAKLDEVLQ